MQEIGVMAMPSDFAYRDVYAKGKPRHDKYDRFSILHPNMDRGKRAKIFAPFDALKGFSELIGSKQNVYCFKKQLNEDEQNELSRRLTVLKNLTYNSRMARQNRVLITATYYLAGHENSRITMDIYAKVKYNNPETLSNAVCNAFSKLALA